jgi:hypothetical protein
VRFHRAGNLVIKPITISKLQKILVLGLGQLHKAKGKTEKARDCITHAIDAFEKCEADVFLKQAREALAALR